jgi:hypothetical protein
MVLWDVTLYSFVYKRVQIPENRSSMFLRMLLPIYRDTLHHKPEDKRPKYIQNVNRNRVHDFGHPGMQERLDGLV